MIQHIIEFSADDLVGYIDWRYLYHAWGIPPGRQNDDAAMQLKEEALGLLIEEKCCIKALFALCDARSKEDDIIIENSITLPLLRQQHAKDGSPNLCLSDFISPKGDKIGLFATSVTPFGDNGDPYRQLLCDTLCDRLAEAAAVRLHQRVRSDEALWGYALGEQLSIAELLDEKNSGIRPAIGYPSLPDQTVIFIIDQILNLSQIGISLTPNGAMHPHASVCGLIISHPASHYFAVGEISEEQLSDYALRRNIDRKILAQYLAKNIE